jgi:hypothetical protein
MWEPIGSPGPESMGILIGKGHGHHKMLRVSRIRLGKNVPEAREGCAMALRQDRV